MSRCLDAFEFVVLLSVCLLIINVANAKKVSPLCERREMIRQSIFSYPGTCPCPYSTMKNGRKCGGRSAWSKPGGASPLCYSRDITDKMLKDCRVNRLKK